MRRTTILLLTGFPALAGGCSYHTEKLPPGPGLGSAGANFSVMQSEIFGPRCARCHAGDIVASYENVVANLEEITRRIQLPSGTRGAMPPGAPLSQRERDALLVWVRAGAPRDGTTSPAPSVPDRAPPAPGAPNLTFGEVQSRVFIPKCARCHAGMMANADSVRANLSAIDRMVSSGAMPPARAPQLTEEERQLVLRWIASGAPEGAVPSERPPSARPEGGCHGLIRHGDSDDNDHHEDDHEEHDC